MELTRKIEKQLYFLILFGRYFEVILGITLNINQEYQLGSNYTKQT